ncbi:MerR family transcriptional regulator [Pedobacter fastidiosus]|uniref:MerR family transcriptional regulator n=1 Tax=Pedobacter fastidiosus TaxID=2765361 RepID=A0ABR7KYW8_9SPHI|nr:MerR family transcriptional regulator [Pedobacter fastidiosus]MBC6112898.1 MerR family transcriptional regulator [Pedobacter fastidiosus]
MLIGQLVKETGLTKDTIRYYEKHGLISIGRKERRDNNYKEYSDVMKTRLFTVKRLKNFGFTLNEIADLLNLIDVNEASCGNVSHKIEEKVTLLDGKIRELISIRAVLFNSLKKCNDNCNPSNPEDNCPILISDL